MNQVRDILLKSEFKIMSQVALLRAKLLKVTLLGITLTILCCLLLPSCTLRSGNSKPVQFSYYTAVNVSSFRRIGIIPFYYAQDVGSSAHIIDTSMTAAIRELGMFETTIISKELRDKVLGADVTTLSAIDPFKLRELRQITHVDAIIIGRIEQYDGFDPMSMGLECHMVSCTDARTLWSANAHFDSRRRDVQEDIQKWHRRAVGLGNTSIGGWQLTLHTPQLFTRYVSDRLAASVLF